jgi:hypothetical protein
MATLNPFDLLGADDGDDPSQLIAAAAAAAQKAEAKKAATAPAGKAAQPAAAAKFPTKPAPPSQAGELIARMLDLGFWAFKILASSKFQCASIGTSLLKMFRACLVMFSELVVHP